MMPEIRHILLAEDNPGDVLLIREAIREAGLEVEVHEAPNGREAMRYLRRQGPHAQSARPDLLILDLNLPAQNGWEVLADIASDPALLGLPIAILTSSRSDSGIVDRYPPGRCVYHTKPAAFDDLVDVVRQIDRFWKELA